MDDEPGVAVPDDDIEDAPIADATKSYEVYLDAEFLVSGPDAAGLVAAAISKLEQLKGGPLSELERPTIAGVNPRALTPGLVWEATVRATIRRPAEFLVVEHAGTLTFAEFDNPPLP